ncbi:amidohydrolase [Metabacillus idriensis]|uniref:amidohydrolase n=1 Tax=Metabacillus idriensis TaxID=324768 RepID=UPI0028145969|nr:amidohydrolase [Metabacillus idriensis]MDR0138054.1 amidohydrolase [Metabacillus idriensis]
MGTLWFGGTIYTLIEENDTVEAVYVENGLVVDAGEEEKLRAEYPCTEEVDLEGSVMIPGFTDSHMHLMGHGEKLLHLDFTEMTSSDQVLQSLRERAERLEPGTWIVGEGWNENQFKDKKIIHRRELDEVTGAHPVMLKRICHHAVIANTKALELAGITSATPDPEGGVIVKDHEGNPTGYLLDQAQELVFQAQPQVSKAYLREALMKSIEDCHKKGLVGGHTEDLAYYGSLENTLQAYDEVINHEKMKFRAHLLVHHLVTDEFHQKERDLGPFIEFGAMKLFADGALGGRTALLSGPYQDDRETNGVSIHSDEDLKRLIQTARNYGMEVAIHTIGDLAFEKALDAIEAHPPVKRNQHDRLIHAQILRRDLIERAKNLPIILDIQPRFVSSDFPWVIERIGADKMKDCYAWKTLISEGLKCAGGSDAPIEPIDPILGIYSAVKRESIYDHQVYMPEERLSVYEAVELYTKGSAYAVHHDHDRGCIAKGFSADFTVLSRDIFKEDALLETEVVMTVVDNTIVYKRERHAD